MSNYWGEELIVNASGADIEAISDYNTVYDFIKYLVPAIDMIAYGEPQIVHFGTGNKSGFTLVQLIETSSITAHFVNETGDIFFNCFSCKPFDPNVVLSGLFEYFQYEKQQNVILKRYLGSVPMIIN